MKEGVNPIIPSYAIDCVDKYSPGPPGGCCPLSPAKSFAGWRQVIQMKGTVYQGGIKYFASWQRAVFNKNFGWDSVNHGVLNGL